MKNLFVILFCLSTLATFSQKTTSNDEKMNAIIENIKRIPNGENFDSAYYYFQQGLSLSKELDNKEKIVDLYFAIGTHYNCIGLYDKALELYMKADEMISNSDENRRMVLFYKISSVFAKKLDFDKSIKYIEKAIEMAKKTKNNKALLLIFFNKGCEIRPIFYTEHPNISYGT